MVLSADPISRVDFFSKQILLADFFSFFFFNGDSKWTSLFWWVNPVYGI